MNIKSRMNEIGVTDQNVIWKEYLDFETQDGRTYRAWLEIKANPYRSQCHAFIKVWTPAGWTNLCWLTETKVETNLYVRERSIQMDPKHFKVDRNNLLWEARVALD